MSELFNEKNSSQIPGVYIKTYGCQMNAHDSERMLGLMLSSGYQVAETPEEAQVILINTCAVREKPERKLLAQLGRLKRIKEKNPHLVIGVTGCMAPRDGEIIREKAPYVDILLGPRSLHRLPQLVEAVQRLRQPIEAIDLSDDPTPLTPIRRASPVSAWVDVIFGCSFACTFCAVPSARGPERSRPPEDILNEVKELQFLGYKEVTLLGQTVNAYGRDRRYRFEFRRQGDLQAHSRERIDFAWLLRAIDRVVQGSMRVRFTSPHPTLFTDRLIEAIGELPSVCEHVHLPLQSGDDEILRRMRRAYTYSQFYRVVEKLRARVPDIAITTDIIVGFPGETEEQFRRTLKAVEDLAFDQAFMFIYSPRRHTLAAAMPDQVPSEVAQRRFQELVATAHPLFQKKNQQEVGKWVEILVEGPSPKDPSRLWGRTRTNKMVVFDPPAADGRESKRSGLSLIGELINVRLTRAFIWGWEGVWERNESERKNLSRVSPTQLVQIS